MWGNLAVIWCSSLRCTGGRQPNPLVQDKAVFSVCSISSYLRLSSHRGPAHVSQPEWDCRERPIGKKWDSRLSNFAATVIHQALGRWQWKWLMETDRWALTFHWFVLKKHRAWDLLSEHDHVHYDCHLRPFLYISMGSLQQKKMEEMWGAQKHTQGKILLHEGFCCSCGFVVVYANVC